MTPCKKWFRYWLVFNLLIVVAIKTLKNYIYEEQQQEKGVLAGTGLLVASPFPIVAVDVDGSIFIMMMVRHVSVCNCNVGFVSIRFRLDWV